MNMQEKIARVTALAHAKNNQNVAEALLVYHPEVEMITPAFSAHARGGEETGRQLRYFFRLFPDYNVQVSDFQEEGAGLFARGLVRVTPNTSSGKALTAEVPVTMSFEFKGTSISKEVFNIDLALVAEKAGIPLNELLGA